MSNAFFQIKMYNVRMKKILTFLIILFLGFLPAFADYLPSYINNGYHYGIGLIALKGDVPIYEMSDLKSPLAAFIKLEKNKVTIKERGVKNPEITNTFVAYSKENGLALLSVEIDDDDWFYICYDQKRKLFGWVKKNENIDFMYWEDFLNLYGRKRGVYIFNNTPDIYKRLYSQEKEESTMVDSFNFPKHIALWLIKGNWMLVKITTYDGLTKTGWMRWRTENGAVMVFPDFRN